MNRALEKAGCKERVDSRSFKDRLPTVHLGVEATQMERRGEKTRLGDQNRLAQDFKKLQAEAQIIDFNIARTQRQIAGQALAETARELTEHRTARARALWPAPVRAPAAPKAREQDYKQGVAANDDMSRHAALEKAFRAEGREISEPKAREAEKEAGQARLEDAKAEAEKAKQVEGQQRAYRELLARQRAAEREEEAEPFIDRDAQTAEADRKIIEAAIRQEQERMREEARAQNDNRKMLSESANVRRADLQDRQIAEQRALSRRHDRARDEKDAELEGFYGEDLTRQKRLLEAVTDRARQKEGLAGTLYRLSGQAGADRQTVEAAEMSIANTEMRMGEQWGKLNSEQYQERQEMERHQERERRALEEKIYREIVAEREGRDSGLVEKIYQGREAESARDRGRERGFDR